MKTPTSLRARLLLGAALWTVGLFGLAVVTWHVALGFRYPPALFNRIFSHTALVTVVCAACLVAGLLQVRRGWASVNQVRSRLGQLRDGREQRLEGDYPAEVAPLVGDLNALLDQREQTVSRARAKAGDLAHGLKTPLAVLAQEAERAAAAGHDDLAATLRQQVDRMRRQVDYHLAQARMGSSAGPLGGAASAAPRAAAEGIARTLQRLHAERGVRVAVDMPEDLQAHVDREDLDEMLGNLMDNACKWARAAVRVSAARDGARVVIRVEDDGPGIEPSLREMVLARGTRADETAPGSGLGLSIVRDLADAYGGHIVLDESAMGGLRATLALPASPPMPSRDSHS